LCQCGDGLMPMNRRFGRFGLGFPEGNSGRELVGRPAARSAASPPDGERPMSGAWLRGASTENLFGGRCNLLTNHIQAPAILSFYEG